MRLGIGLILVLALLPGACTTGRQIDRFKGAAARGDYAAIVTDPVTCTAEARGCAQLRLMAGDACFRLAVAGTPARYDCAIRELGRGLDQISGPSTEIGSTEPYWQNLMESLRRRRDLASSSLASAGFTRELEARARGFAALFPGHPAGPYFLASARFGAVLDGPDGWSAATCDELDRLRRLLAPVASSPGPYAPAIARLLSDLAATRAVMPECRA